MRVLRTCRADGSHQWCWGSAPLVRSAKHITITYQNRFNLSIETSYRTKNKLTNMRLKQFHTQKDTISATDSNNPQSSSFTSLKTLKTTGSAC